MATPCQADMCPIKAGCCLQGDVIFAENPINIRRTGSPLSRIIWDAHWGKGTIRIQGPQRDADLGTFTSRPL